MPSPGVDILSIDTEGHDHEILRQIDFESVRPRVLLYGHEYICAGWNENGARRCWRPVVTL
ncbi:MAG: FkbM family methyltransferase [Gammaproteobacteria bacterium]